VVLPKSNSYHLKMSPASIFQSYFTDMKCALDLLDQDHTFQKMSTGSAEFDSLIDGVQENSFYLFYSSHENQLVLDSFLYRQLISCILPKAKKNGFESVAIFLNNIDLSIYHIFVHIFLCTCGKVFGCFH
jgi:hypothetical protein